jgi:hypothetical protein
VTSQFPTPPADATRLLLVLDAPIGAAEAEALEALVAGYSPVLVGAEEDSGVAARLARHVGAPLQANMPLGGGSGDAGSVLAVVRSMLAAHAKACIVVVASEAVLRPLLCEALGVPLAAAWRFRVEAGAVSVVEVGSDGRWALVRLNERGDPPAG